MVRWIWFRLGEQLHYYYSALIGFAQFIEQGGTTTILPAMTHTHAGLNCH